jgi:hypothetical protein
MGNIETKKSSIQVAEETKAASRQIVSRRSVLGGIAATAALPVLPVTLARPAEANAAALLALLSFGIEAFGLYSDINALEDAKKLSEIHQRIGVLLESQAQYQKNLKYVIIDALFEERVRNLFAEKIVLGEVLAALNTTGGQGPLTGNRSARLNIVRENISRLVPVLETYGKQALPAYVAAVNLQLQVYTLLQEPEASTNYVKKIAVSHLERLLEKEINPLIKQLKDEIQPLSKKLDTPQEIELREVVTIYNNGGNKAPVPACWCVYKSGFDYQGVDDASNKPRLVRYVQRNLQFYSSSNVPYKYNWRTQGVAYVYPNSYQSGEIPGLTYSDGDYEKTDIHVESKNVGGIEKHLIYAKTTDRLQAIEKEQLGHIQRYYQGLINERAPLLESLKQQEQVRDAVEDGLARYRPAPDLDLLKAAFKEFLNRKIPNPSPLPGPPEGFFKRKLPGLESD